MELVGKRVMVFGSGKSGISASRLLLETGANVYLYDQNEDLDLNHLMKEIGQPIEIVAGLLPESYLKETELMIISPGIPCDTPLVKAFQAAQIPVWSEIELAYRIGKGKVLAITGTNGKTTTTALLGKIMEDYYPEVYVVGNIGIPYTMRAAMQSENAYTVAEVSSFQLETIDRFHPVASAITNITEDHLNRHHTMEEYIRVKELITKNQTAEDVCVLNYEDPVLRRFGEQLPCRVIFFSSGRKLQDGIYYADGEIRFAQGGIDTLLVRTDEIQLLGKHNFENIMTAAAMARFTGVPIEQIRSSIQAFSGVAHRIEFVAEKNHVRYYNDSKGTNPDAAIQAIRAMNRPTLLIGGGYDKQSTYEEWISAFDNKVRKFVLIGATKEKIRSTALSLGFPAENIVMAQDLKEAVLICAKEAQEGDAVLLSPACASWDQFKSYEQRGDLFKQYVGEL